MTGKKLSLEKRHHLSKTLKDRGIAPSPEAREKARQINLAKPKLPKIIKCLTEDCEALLTTARLCKACYDKKRLTDPSIKAKRKQNTADKISKDPDFYRRQNIKKYGITLDQYNEVVVNQYGQCDICEDVPYGEGKGGILYIDHCHSTGFLRGLLCQKCNTAIGALREDIEIMESAIAYLAKHGIEEPPIGEEGAF